MDVRERMKGSAEWPRWVRSYVSSYLAIWSQPVVHELHLLATPTLFMVGTRDRTAPGRAFAAPEDARSWGGSQNEPNSSRPGWPTRAWRYSKALDT